MRIVSLLPGGTQTLLALGLGDRLVAVSHECVLPAGRELPRIVSSPIDPSALSSAEIDAAVRAHLREGRPLFRLDEDRLRALAPDVILTQRLCRVCALGGADVERAAAALPSQPTVIALHPHTLGDMLDDVLRIGEAAGVPDRARELREALEDRIDRVQRRIDGAARPRVFCAEWLDPLMAAGHWVPEQVALAGGTEVLGRAGERSRYVEWEAVAAVRPEVLLLMPCGLPMEQARREWPRLTAQPAWEALPAVREGRVYLLDGPSSFSCPGPRLVDGVELLARVLHSDRFPDPPPASAALRVDEAPPCGRPR
jgi:iron complex transport system substrate-binding protein